MNLEIDKFRVVTVGTGCAVPSLRRGSACLLIQADGRNIVVDLGLGGIHGLLRAGVIHREVESLFFTHFHTDHTADLSAFLFAANYDETPRAAPLSITGGEGLSHYMEALENLHGKWVAPKGYAREVRSAKPGDSFALGGVRATAGPASHETSSLSWRFEHAGRAVVVTGDTGPDSRLADFARGADLLVAEASLPHGMSAHYHLTAEESGRLAAEAGVGALVLTHFYPSSEADDPVRRAGSVYAGPVFAAHDGDEFVLPPPPSLPNPS